MKCKICSKNTKFFAKSRILREYEISYFRCFDCGFVQTEEPYWLETAYRESINISDTGILCRNNYFARVIATILYFLYNKRASYLDYAGGYGLLVRLMRDIGFDFYWYDPYSQNIFARGFEYDPETTDIELVTAIECFEHFVDPLAEIEKMLKVNSNILFTTELLPEPTPALGKWWYYGLDHGQHISFYTKNTLKYCAELFGSRLLSIGSVHLLTSKNVSDVYFNMLVKLARYGLFQFVDFKMQSKMDSDSQELSSK